MLILRRRRTAVAILVLTCAAAAASSTSLATAEPGGSIPQREGSPPGSSFAVDDAADAASAFWKSPGFGKVAVDYEATTVRVSWKGTPPEPVTDLTKAPQNGVTVELVPAAFSQDDMDAAGAAVLAEAREKGSSEGMAFVPSTDMASATIEIPDGSPADSRSTRASLSRAAGDIPTTIKAVENLPVDLTRQNDSPRWQGGGAIADSTGDDFCSTGFAILLSNGEGRLTTAAHCNLTLGQTVRNGVGSPIGPATVDSNSHDATLIDPTASPATAGKVFGGPWSAGESNPRYQFFVAAAGPPSMDMRVCPSGARTGEHLTGDVCSAVVYATGVSFTCPVGGAFTCTGFRARRNAGNTLIGVGDSGGPVYSLRSDGFVTARGTINQSQGAEVVPCGQTTAEPTHCFYAMQGVGIHSILNHWNAEIET